MFNKIMCFWRENKKECWKKKTGALYEQQFFSLFVPTLTNISLYITECDDEPRWQRESTLMRRWGVRWWWWWWWWWWQMMTEGEYIDEAVRWQRGAGQRSDKGRSGVVINHCGIPTDRPTDRLVMSHCGLVTLSKRLISTPAGYRDPLQCIERGRYQPTCYKGTRNYHARTILCNTTQYFCVHYPAHTQYHARSCKALQYQTIQDNLMLLADIMALLPHCILINPHCSFS